MWPLPLHHSEALPEDREARKAAEDRANADDHHRDRRKAKAEADPPINTETDQTAPRRADRVPEERRRKKERKAKPTRWITIA